MIRTVNGVKERERTGAEQIQPSGLFTADMPFEACFGGRPRGEPQLQGWATTGPTSADASISQDA